MPLYRRLRDDLSLGQNHDEALSGLRRLAGGYPAIESQVSAQVSDIYANVFPESPPLQTCSVCRSLIYQHYFEETGPYLYCPSCAGGSHPLAGSQRVTCDPDSWCEHGVADLKKELAVNTFCVVSIEDSTPYRKRVMNEEALLFWKKLQELRVRCLNRVYRDYSPVPQWYQGNDQIRLELEASEARDHIRMCGNPPEKISLFKPIRCPTCGAQPQRYNGPELQYSPRGTEIVLHLTATLNCLNEHRWQATAISSIEAQSDPSIGPISSGGFSHSQDGGIELSLVCGYGRDGEPCEELRAIGFEGTLERLLFNHFGSGGSYYEGCLDWHLENGFHALRAVILKSTGIEYAITDCLLWTERRSEGSNRSG